MTVVGAAPNSISQLRGSPALVVPWQGSTAGFQQDMLPCEFPLQPLPACPCDGGVHLCWYGCRPEGEFTVHVVHTRIAMVTGRIGWVYPFNDPNSLTPAGAKIAALLGELTLVADMRMAHTTLNVTVAPVFPREDCTVSIFEALKMAACPNLDLVTDSPETSERGFYL